MEDIFSGAEEIYGFKGEQLDANGRKFLVIDGMVGVSAGLSDQHSILNFVKGEIFPLADFGKIHSRRPLTYRLVSNCRLKVLPENKFYERVRTGGHQDALYQLISGILARAIQRIDNLGFTSVNQRLFYRLEYLAEQFGKDIGGRIVIDLPITHTELAASINTTRESVSRIFQKLDEKQIISFENHTLVINSVDELRQALAP